MGGGIMTDLTTLEQQVGPLPLYRAIIHKFGPGHHRLGRQETRDAFAELLAALDKVAAERDAMRAKDKATRMWCLANLNSDAHCGLIAAQNEALREAGEPRA
jgi:hypothetical protein